MTDVHVYSADLVLPITAPPILDGLVAVAGGRIRHVGDRAWVLAALRDDGIEAAETHVDGVLMPGLINAHTHLQYTGMAEVGQQRFAGVDDWDVAFMSAYEREHDFAAAAAAGAEALIRSGTTSAADVVTDVAAAGALHDSGLNGIAYWEVMSWSNADWAERGREQVLAELDAVPPAPGIGLSPHAPYSLEIQPLLDLPDLVRARGLRLHIHLGEAEFEGAGSSEATEAWHRAGLGSFRALRSQGYGASATEFIDHLGVLGPDCHIAHGVYMTADDRALLRARGTSVALCPRSNEIIGLAAPPVADYLREGSPVAVGTDSLSSSPSLDLMADVAALVRIARDQGYAERDLHARVLGAATLGGARAMGLDVGPQRTGYLAVGARADLAAFALPVTTVADTLALLAEDGAGRAVATVIAGEPRWNLDGGLDQQTGASA